MEQPVVVRGGRFVCSLNLQPIRIPTRADAERAGVGDFGVLGESGGMTFRSVFSNRSARLCRIFSVSFGSGDLIVGRRFELGIRVFGGWSQSIRVLEIRGSCLC